MKKPLIVVAAAVALVMVTGGLMPAISQPPGQRTVLTWFDPGKTDFEKELNLGGRGFKAGDMVVIKDSMFDTGTCENSATLVARFQVVKRAGRENAFFVFDGGLLLPDGKLTLYLPAKFSEFESEDGAAGAVTGGTGAYRDVTGELRVDEGHAMCDRRGALVTADLLLE